MRTRHSFVVAGLMIGMLCVLLIPREAHAQQVGQVPPQAERDENWEAVGNVSMIIGASTVFLMPRVYYNDPEATVGWKGRWHVSQLAPATSLIAITWLVDQPIKNGIESTRPGCSLRETQVRFPDSNCETFGGPSTHAFASWGTTGAGVGIFLVDTLKYSDGRFHAGSFIGNVVVPLATSVLTTVSRAVEPGTADAFEDGGQLVAGAIPGFFSGLLIGLGYSLLQEPSCGYGDNIFCW
jgi:hypothetical protein